MGVERFMSEGNGPTGGVEINTNNIENEMSPRSDVRIASTESSIAHAQKVPLVGEELITFLQKSTAEMHRQMQQSRSSQTIDQVVGQRSGVGNLANVHPELRQAIEAANAAGILGPIYTYPDVEKGDLIIERDVDEEGKTVFFARDTKTGAQAGIVPGSVQESEMVLGGPWPVHETLHIVTEAGITIDRDIPQSAAEKIEWMRTLVMEVEKEGADMDSDPSVKRRVSDMYSAITFLMSDEYKTNTTYIGDQKDTIGKRLHDEFIHRLSFHNAFLAFTDVNDEAGLEGVEKKIGGDILNTLFRIKEFRYALTYFELHGEAYDDNTAYAAPGVPMLNPDGTAKTISDDEAHKRFREGAAAWLGGIAVANGMEAQNAEWASRLAERFFRVSGRREKFAQLRTTATGHKFRDSTSKGDDVLRKILRLKDWVLSDDERDNYRVNWRLMKDVDLMAWDYIHELMTDKVVGGIKAATLAKTGVERNISTAFVDVGGVQRFDFTQIDYWEDVDFGEDLAGSSMEYWAGKRIKSPGAAKEALIGKPDSYLRNPTEQSLVAMKEALGYQKKDRWKNLKQMVVNFVDWEMSEEFQEETDIKPLNEAEAESVVFRLANNLGMKKEEFQETLNRVMGPDFTKKLLLIYHRHHFGSAFLAFLWAIISGVVGASVSTK